MAIRFFGPACLLFGAGTAFTSIQHGAPSAAAPGDVAAMFKQRCASCHIPPDLRFKADKAWLGQIRETA